MSEKTPVRPSAIKKKKRSLAPKPWHIGVTILVILFLWWAIPSYIIKNHPNDMPGAGQTGDVYGSVNALFSGLAFALLIAATLMQGAELRLQRQELRLQRKELELTRDELKKSAEAQSKLVSLTDKQLRLQENIRAASIKPRFTFVDGAREPQAVNNPFVIVALVVNNKCQIVDYRFGEDVSGYRFNNQINIRNFGRYFNVGDKIKIAVEMSDKRGLKGFAVYVYYHDEDKSLYRQEFYYDPNLGMIVAEPERMEAIEGKTDAM